MFWELIYIVSCLAILPVLIFAIIASIRVTTVINRYHHLQATTNITAKDLVERIALENNLHINLETASDGEGDHYDPHAKTIRLTEKVINSNSISALAIAAHECGHALQDARNYLPLRLRNAVIRVNNFSSRLLTPLIIISFIATLFTAGLALETMLWVMFGFCIIYGLTAIISFVTLPTEYNASRLGKQMLISLNIIETKAEKRGVSKVLRAAANTYVVSFAMSLVYFLRYLSKFMIILARRRD